MARRMLEPMSKLDRVVDVLMGAHQHSVQRIHGIEVELYVDDREPMEDIDDDEVNVSVVSLTLRQKVQLNVEYAVHPQPGNVHGGYPIAVMHAMNTAEFTPLLYVERDYSMLLRSSRNQKQPFDGKSINDLIAQLNKDKRSRWIAADALLRHVRSYMMLDEQRFKLKESGGKWEIMYDMRIANEQPYSVVTLDAAADLDAAELRWKLYKAERSIKAKLRGD